MNDFTPPPNWGKDHISDFIDQARHNTFASFANLKQRFNRLINIDKSFRTIIDNLLNSKEFIPSFFLMRSHSAFLGGSRLALSGQIPETYMVLRGALENALYGLYVSRNPESAEIWLSRHDDDKSKKKTRDLFKFGTVIAILKSIDEKAYGVAQQLYDRCIDLGAHPNERSVTAIMNMTKEDNIYNYEIEYLTGNKPALHLALKSTAQIGVCSLDIFRHVFKERFDILGISTDLEKLKKGL